MSACSFRAADLSISVSAPAAETDHLSHLFARFPMSGANAPDIALSATGDTVAWQAAGRSGTARVGSREFLTPALLSLVPRLMHLCRPELLFLHGNLLAHPESGRAVLFTGESGSGKTTLAALLIREGWRSAAEDTVPLDTETALALPWPRAASYRRSDGGKDWIESASPWSEPVSLQHAGVVLLRTAAEQPAREPQPETLWFTAPPAESIAGLGPARADGPLWQANLTPDAACSAVFAALADQGCLVVHAARHPPSAETSPRPPAPHLARLPGSEGAAALLRDCLRFPEDAGQPAGLQLICLARCVADAEFFRLTPGGTPRDTLQALRAELSL